MNVIKATVEKIESSGEVVLVFLRALEDSWRAMMIDVNSLKGFGIGIEIEMLFKETEVMVASVESKISARNAFVADITKITNGALLSEVEFDYFGKSIRAIITREAVMALDLRVGERAKFFIKSNEITLRILNG